MRIPSLVATLLVVAALAGCTGGHDTAPTPLAASAPTSASGTASATNTTTGSNSTGPRHNATLVASLNVSATNGTPPLLLNLTFGATPSGNVTWTLTINATPLQPANGTGNGTGGNSTGNGTGNSTGNSAPGNSTGNPTGNPTGNSTGSSTGNTTGNGSASGGDRTVASFNGTGADLPGNRSVWLNESASYRVEFVVHASDGSVAERNATVNVTGPAPGTRLGQESMSKKGTILLGGTELDCDAFGGADVPWALNATFNGTPAEADHLWVNLTGSTGADYALHLVAPNGTEVGHADDGLAAEALDLNGTFPAGNYTIHISSCNAAASSWSVVATAEYVVARTA